MAKQVLKKKQVRNAILWSGLQLFDQGYWHKKKNKKDLAEYSQNLQQMMQVYFKTDNVVVGIPTFRQEVMLFELDKENPGQHHYEIQKIIDCAQGRFIKIDRALAA